MAFYVIAPDWTYYASSYEHALRIMIRTGGTIEESTTGPPPPVVDSPPPRTLTEFGRAALEKKLGRSSLGMTDFELINEIPWNTHTYSWHKDWEVLKEWGYST